VNPAWEILLLAGGGALGSALRGWLGERFATLLPWTTLFINVTGSFAAGWLAAQTTGKPGEEWLWAFGLVGICGGYTTFSTMAFQSLVMWRERRGGRLVFYLAVTLALGLGAAWAGLAAGAK
jgi:CrcB protein